jgi:hypothetical protein
VAPPGIGTPGRSLAASGPTDPVAPEKVQE